MTKKDFEAFARGFKNVKHYSVQGREGWIFAIQECVAIFKQSNSKFDTAKFLNACGITQGEQNTYFTI